MFKLTREFYEPKEGRYAEKIVQGDTVVYVETDLKTVKVFGGKRAKSDSYIQYRTPEQAQSAIKSLLERRAANEVENAKYKAERKAKNSAPRTFKVGDILHGSWGYDQTNNDFFQVVEIVSPRKIAVKKIGKTYRQSGHDCGYVTAAKDSFISDKVTVHLVQDGHIKYDPCGYYKNSSDESRERNYSASLWSGGETYESSYA